MDEKDDQVEMLALLREHGIVCEYENSFIGMVESTGRKGRILCAEVRHPDCISGKSFWIHKGPDFWYLGLWNGFLFSVGPNANIVELVSTMLKKKSTRIPCSLPKILMQRHNIKKIDE